MTNVPDVRVEIGLIIPDAKLIENSDYWFSPSVLKPPKTVRTILSSFVILPVSSSVKFNASI
jgi:hypothetical protein